ncbi:hypothetical protein CQR47_1170 [Bifidobacterium thermophilum]|uniref:Uncharacterized protein n=1 Tax=Bifidobacterium thermophilum TaxID=33905 RepID=A0A2N3QK31_9BIFI|nr:hypothetical protein CQR48_1246 [Bifidobacterium thermophilum]PKU91833.1 hypothetical protein CQR47_1170 [Bifidobacterium thermophilum]
MSECRENSSRSAVSAILAAAASFKLVLNFGIEMLQVYTSMADTRRGYSH